MDTNADLDNQERTYPPDPYAVDETEVESTAAADPVSPATEQDAAALRQEIQHTRDEMAGTIDELQDRLTPEHVAEQAKQAARDAAAERVQNLTNSVADGASAAAGGVSRVASTYGRTALQMSGTLAFIALLIVIAVRRRQEPEPPPPPAEGLAALRASVGRLASQAAEGAQSAATRAQIQVISASSPEVPEVVRENGATIAALLLALVLTIAGRLVDRRRMEDA